MKHILIIDDSKAVHAYVKNCFKTFDVKLTHVLNGQEALDLIKSGSTDFNLILLDWEMPIMDGPSTFDSLKCKVTIPVIMMTTKNQPEDISFMLNKGVSEYVLKPFTQDILLDKIQNVLGQELCHAQ